MPQTLALALAIGTHDDDYDNTTYDTPIDQDAVIASPSSVDKQNNGNGEPIILNGHTGGAIHRTNGSHLGLDNNNPLSAAAHNRDNDDNHHLHDSTTTTTTTTTTNSNNTNMLYLSFWLLGLLNNTSYVIMIASAKTISEDGTALVFLANILPGMTIKLTAPYWFDYAPYKVRMMTASALMVSSFAVVASLMSTTTTTTTTATTTAEATETASMISARTLFQLMGVALGSAQCGLGEASLLAAAGKCDTTGKGVFLSCFSSGTGLAGVLGFLWKFFWNEWLGLPMATTLWLAQSLAFCYWGIFWHWLNPHLLQLDTREMYHTLAVTPEEEQPLELTTYHDHDQQLSSSSIINDQTESNETDAEANDESSDDFNDEIIQQQQQQDEIQQQLQHAMTPKKPVHEMTFWERTHFIGALWPYIIPLFVVYATEYSLQAGTWTAIGFPVDDRRARDEFYEYSNWMYQAGVFVSRSSGSLGTAPMSILWLMPTLQALNVVFFAYVAAYHFWYQYSLLMPVCFYVGLLGGAVYCHGYKRICADFDLVDRREFALSTTSVAESLGIVCADIMGLFIQSCLYRTNGISGAIVSCPIPAASGTRHI